MVTLPSVAAETEKKKDGRVARGRRTQDAIVEALLALVGEGSPNPTAQEIADRARVSLRTIRHHFPTRESLILAAGARRAEVLPVLRVVRARDRSLDERIDRFVDERVAWLRATTELRAAAAAQESRSPSVRKMSRAVRQERRRVTEATFEDVLDALPKRRRLCTLEALDVASSGVTWDSLRGDQRLDVGDATAVVRQLIAALLASARRRKP